MNPYSVLVRPILSEKSVIAREGQNKYSFVVRMEADKVVIKKAVEKLFDVKVEAVNTSILRGKPKRRGNTLYLRDNSKRAVVTLKEGEKIALFEDK